MRINTNISAMNSHRQLGANTAAGQKSMEKLSSGLRINRAGDDAAGLAISEKMRGQIRGLNQASRNAQDGISMIQTAEGALNETHAILQRMRELSVQSASDTNTKEDRAELQKEVNQLAQEITRIGDNTEFNTQKLLNGELDVKFHIGANSDQNMEISIDDMRTSELGVVGHDFSSETLNDLEFTSLSKDEATIAFETVTAETAEIGVSVTGNTITVTLASADTSTTSTSTQQQVMDAINANADASKLVNVSSIETPTNLDAVVAEAAADVTLAAATENENKGIDISSQAAADAAITTIDAAIEKVSAQRSELGSFQNRLEHTISNLGTSAENLQAAESRVRDLDMAQEMMDFTKNNILQQAATSMLAQANMAPQSVLQLLG